MIYSCKSINSSIGRFGSSAQLTNPSTSRLLLNVVKCIGKFSTTSTHSIPTHLMALTKSSVLYSFIVYFSQKCLYSTFIYFYLGEVCKLKMLLSSCCSDGDFPRIDFGALKGPREFCQFLRGGSSKSILVKTLLMMTKSMVLPVLV